MVDMGRQWDRVEVSDSCFFVFMSLCMQVCVGIQVWRSEVNLVVIHQVLSTLGF